jgi:hypothetical protein
MHVLDGAGTVHRLEIAVDDRRQLIVKIVHTFGDVKSHDDPHRLADLWWLLDDYLLRGMSVSPKIAQFTLMLGRSMCGMHVCCLESVHRGGRRLGQAE